MDDFGFSLAPEPALEPLDLTSTPPLVPPRQSQGIPGGMGGGVSGQGGGDRKGMMRLMALLPIALAKGGQQAAAALLQGYQQGVQRQQQQTQQQSVNQRQASQAESLDAYRRAQLENQRMGQRRQFLSDFTGKLQTVDDPDAVTGMLDAYGLMGGQLGIERGALDQVAMQIVKPSRIQQNAAQKRIASLKSQFGDKWMEVAKNTTHKLPYTEGNLTLDQVAAIANGGTAQDAVPLQPAASSEFPTDVPLDRLLAQAIATGDTKRADVIRQAIREMDEQRRDPRVSDPVLDEIRRLRLEQMKTPAGAELSPAQFRTAQALADDFERVSKDYVTRVQAYQTINAAASNPTAAGDLAMIFAFMKMLDPASTVREGEFANAQNAAGVPDRIRNAWNRALHGERLNNTQRSDFLGQARAQMEQARVRQKGLAGVYSTRARRMSVPPEFVVIDYDQVFGVDRQSPAQPPAATQRQNPYRGGRTSGAGR